MPSWCTAGVRSSPRPLLVAALALVAVWGCQRATPPAGPPTTPVGPMAEKLKDEGDRLARQGQWEAAVDKYQAAVNREGGDVALRLALGTALSHLDRRAETAEQFKWIVAHGQPGSPDVEVARSWLVNAGELKSAYAPSPAAQPPAAASAVPDAQNGEIGRA